jgi:hypothetical protein
MDSFSEVADIIISSYIDAESSIVAFDETLESQVLSGCPLILSREARHQARVTLIHRQIVMSSYQNARSLTILGSIILSHC